MSVPKTMDIKGALIYNFTPMVTRINNSSDFSAWRENAQARRTVDLPRAPVDTRNRFQRGTHKVVKRLKSLRERVSRTPLPEARSMESSPKASGLLQRSQSVSEGVFVRSNPSPSPERASPPVGESTASTPLAGKKDSGPTALAKPFVLLQLDVEGWKRRRLIEQVKQELAQGTSDIDRLFEIFISEGKWHPAEIQEAIKQLKLPEERSFVTKLQAYEAEPGALSSTENIMADLIQTYRSNPDQAAVDSLRYMALQEELCQLDENKWKPFRK